eukprot:comp6960_c0_seq1/m.2701 comp6960_c0_seq1/g.2701  ORF comp6960_c0_seq1/g.2701 comp6960_c0_seq1/m.2701 type:complete len:538 (-) comp6960_c0_seq1:18-1631(-)
MAPDVRMVVVPGSGHEGEGPSMNKDEQIQWQELSVAEKLKLVQRIMTSQSSTNLLHQAVVELRQMLCIQNEPPIDMVLEAGLLPYLVKNLVEKRDPRVVFESLWALTNLASGNTEQTRQVIDAGVVPLVVELLANPSTEGDVVEQAVWCIGNISGDSKESRDLVLSAGTLPPLLRLIESPNSTVSVRRNVVWAVSNLCRDQTQPNLHRVIDAIPVLRRLLPAAGGDPSLMQQIDEEILTDTCWAMSHVTDDKNSVEMVMQRAPDLVMCMVGLLLHHASYVQTPVLRTIGNVVYGSDRYTQDAIDCGVIPNLVLLLDSPKRNIRKEAAWSLSNICTGPEHHIQAVIQANAVPKVLKLFGGDDHCVVKEAAWCIANISCGTKPQVQYLVERGGAAALAKVLVDQPQARDVAKICLEGLLNLLQVVGGCGYRREYMETVCPGSVRVIEELAECGDEVVCGVGKYLLHTLLNDTLMLKCAYALRKRGMVGPKTLAVIPLELRGLVRPWGECEREREREGFDFNGGMKSFWRGGEGAAMGGY